MSLSYPDEGTLEYQITLKLLTKSMLFSSSRRSQKSLIQEKWIWLKGKYNAKEIIVTLR